MTKSLAQVPQHPTRLRTQAGPTKRTKDSLGVWNELRHRRGYLQCRSKLDKNASTILGNICQYILACYRPYYLMPVDK